MWRICLLVLIICLASCQNEDSDVLGRFHYLIEKMEESPDSVYMEFCIMDSVAQHMGKRQRLLYDLLKIKAKNKSSCLLDKNDEQILLSLLSKNFNNDQHFEVLYLLGSTYRDLNDLPEAAKYFEEAALFGDQNNVNSKSRKLNWGQLSDIYVRMQLFEPTFHAIEQEIKLSREMNDTLSWAIGLEFRGGAKLMQGLNTDALQDISLSCSLLNEIGDTALASQMLITKIGVLFEMKSWDAFEKAIREVEQIDNGIDLNSVKSGAEAYYVVKAKAYIHEQKYDSAKSLLYKVMRDVPERWDLIPHCLERLSEIYMLTGQLDSCCKYQKLLYEIGVTGFRKDAANAVAQLKCSYDYSRQQQKALEAEQASRHKTVIIAVGCVLMLLILSTSIITVLIFKHKAVKRNADFEILRLNFEKEIQALKESKKVSTEELSNREANIMHDARIAIRESLAGMLAEKRHLPIEKEKELIPLANNYFPGFVDALIGKIHKLTSSETTVAILLRFGLRPSEIATLMVKQPSAITNILVRLYTKATGNPGNSAIAREWLESI